MDYPGMLIIRARIGDPTTKKVIIHLTDECIEKMREEGDTARADHITFDKEYEMIDFVVRSDENILYSDMTFVSAMMLVGDAGIEAVGKTNNFGIEEKRLIAWDNIRTIAYETVPYKGSVMNG